MLHLHTFNFMLLSLVTVTLFISNYFSGFILVYLFKLLNFKFVIEF